MPATRTVECDVGREEPMELQAEQLVTGQVGEVLWDGALVAVHYLAKLERDHPGRFLGKTVIELGAGTGLVSMLLHRLGADVTATDLPEICPHIARNAEINHCPELKVQSLSWGKAVELLPPDVLILVDCLYYSESLSPLLQTLRDLSHPSTEILCVYEERDIGAPKEVQAQFMEEARKEFSITTVPLSEQDATFSSPDIHVLWLRRL